MCQHYPLFTPIMTIERPWSVASLKKTKNSIIGNPTLKKKLVQDEASIQLLVQCLNDTAAFSEPQGSTDDIRTEAAHIISSLSYGSEEALGCLLRANALRSLLVCLSHTKASDQVTTKAALVRAVKTLASALAEIVGPSQWGLSIDESVVRDAARKDLDHLFSVEALDIILPLLVDTNTQTSTSVALLLGSAIRTAAHRDLVVEWDPHAERALIKETKTKRGWEKASTVSSLAKRNGGWVVQNIGELLRKAREYKYQEALLLGLAALVDDNEPVAAALTRSNGDTSPVLVVIMELAKCNIPDVQLAASLCAIHTIRANIAHSPVDEAAALAILNIVNRLIVPPSDSTCHVQRRACFILHFLVKDEAVLAYIAYQRGALEKLTKLIEAITPPDLNQREEDEPESISALREAALTAVASIAMNNNDVRLAVADEMKLLPFVEVALGHKHVGVRYAGCQCIRAISRGVAILRTNLVDSGLGMVVFRIFKNEDEDRRVLSAALPAVCNIVNEFSPLKQVYIDNGLMPRLVQLIECNDPTLRFNALWAVKNALTRSSVSVKKDVAEAIGWPKLLELLSDPDICVQEQILNILRNICTDEVSIQMVLDGIGVEKLLEIVLDRMECREDDVVFQAVSLLANLSNGYDEQIENLVINRKLLPALQSCLSDPKSEIRRPTVACIVQLARTSRKARAAMLEAGMDSTLRHLADWRGGGGGLSMSHAHPHPHGYFAGGIGHGHGGPTSPVSAGVSAAREDERDITDHARIALELLDNARRGVSISTDSSEGDIEPW